MKYIVVLGDGMADEPIAELGGKTPLEFARTPQMDRLAARSEIGMTSTIPEGMAPGSDTANLSVLGYDPKQYYTGRSPLEALSIGADMRDGEIAFRCNLVTLTEEDVPYEEQTILDHSSGEISTEEAEVLLKAVTEGLEAYRAELPELSDCRFYVGTSYRHCMIWRNGRQPELTPPHDILEKKIGAWLTTDPLLLKIQKLSYEILKNHPLNQGRKRKGENPANSFWFWGAGTRPALSDFREKFGKKGIMISAVDLLKGIAIGAGMDCAQVAGANGGLDTNYEGKARAAADALLKEDYDFAYIHVEAPDEMGHQGSARKKVQAIENIDRRVLEPLLRQMDASGEPYRLLLLPDHPTPVRLRTHVAEPVPYLLYDSTTPRRSPGIYSERTAAASGRRVEKGWELMKYFLEL